MASWVWLNNININISRSISPPMTTRVLYLEGFRLRLPYYYYNQSQGQGQGQARAVSVCVSQLRSPQLVALEYADLNLPLPDKVL